MQKPWAYFVKDLEYHGGCWTWLLLEFSDAVFDNVLSNSEVLQLYVTPIEEYNLDMYL